MYNIIMGEFHPSMICVDRGRFIESLSNLDSLFVSEFADEALRDYIESYARTDEVMPEDKTIGFVVFNLQKKVVSISMNTVSDSERKRIQDLTNEFGHSGFKCELDLPG